MHLAVVQHNAQMLLVCNYSWERG